jgi:hypothetical protein
MLIGPNRIKRIHVNQHVIRKNKNEGTYDPPLTVQTSDGPYRARHVTIHGPSEVIYSPDKPLSCGARLWVETKAAVELYE